ncbi:MAG TPA: Na+/H+ antiporter [Acetobacteraceae bacterium]|jgi:Na+/H+ antiporter|nr:Na+/H+ antiporter [Acetobacteraceae bacterium]
MTALGAFELVLLLLTAAVLLALLARRLHAPPAVAFVLGGILLAVTPGIRALEFDPDLYMALFLPPLVQASAFFTVWREFRANLRPILLLSIGLVFFTAFSIGWLAKLLLPDVPWAAAFTLGAIISPTDTAVTTAVLSRLPIPKRIVTVLEGESLVNDASGLVLYQVAMIAAMTGQFSPSHAAFSFVLLFAGGIVVGTAWGYGSIWLFRRLHDTNLEIAASFLVAWASYLAAEAVGVSGVLATTTCGLLMGWYQHETFSPETRTQARAAWSVAVFALEALLFILIGLSLRGIMARFDAHAAATLLPLALLISFGVVTARLVWVFPAIYLPRLLLPALRRADPYPPPAVPLVIGWAGMRGAVSLAAALALPVDFPDRDPILLITFIVILVTLLIQGGTLGVVIRLLKLNLMVDREAPPAHAQVRAAIAAVALHVIEERTTDPLDGAIAADMIPEYRDRAGWLVRVHENAATVRAELAARLVLRREALAASRTELLRLHRSREIKDDTLRALEQELDLEDIQLRSQLRAG